MLQSGRNVTLNTDHAEAEYLYISRSQKLNGHVVNYWGPKRVLIRCTTFVDRIVLQVIIL